MKLIETSLPGVVIIEPKLFHDDRGFFYETYHKDRYAEHGIPHAFVQDNLSHSKKHVVRGLHYQLEHAQGKLVFVAYGKVLDVIVDIRVGSPTFGQAITIELSADNRKQVYIPPGLAHGFCVLSEYADFMYKCTDFYYPASEFGLRWNDPDLGIEWPVLDQDVILSAKDQAAPCLKDISKEYLPKWNAK